MIFTRQAYPEYICNMLIGLFDSGVGGLTVLAACRRALPGARYLYLDDCANCPYGGRTGEEITALARDCADVLIRAGCDAVVIACNTATAAAASVIRARYPDKTVLGIEPAVKPALAAVKGRVLLLATPATAALRRYGSRVIVGAEPRLAEEIERAYGDPEALRALASATLAKYSGYSAVVTGCSHYAHLIPYIPCPVFDGADGVARLLASKFAGRPSAEAEAQ